MATCTKTYRCQLPRSPLMDSFRIADKPGVIPAPRLSLHKAGVLGSTCSCQSRHSLTERCRLLKMKRPENHGSPNDWPDHLALPHRREAGLRRDGCGLQG